MMKKRYFIIGIIITLIIILFTSGYLLYVKYTDIKIETSVTKKESDILDFTIDEYYLEKNLDRYITYHLENPLKSIKEVVRDVNVNIDRPFYTEPLDSNLNDGILILVNKYHKLSENYAPKLVNMSSKHSHAYTKKMQNVAYQALKEMIDAASLDNIILYDVSSYRSYNTQSILYNNYVKNDGFLLADTYSARAGYSEHQTGLATDLNTASSSSHFEESKEFAWLNENAYKYGFILRYPKDKEYLTGYKFEPWHYRYVGVEAATYIKEHDITFDEYYAFFIEKN